MRLLYKSLRFRNMAIFTILSTTLLSLFAVAIYINLEKKLYSDIDGFLRTTAVSLSDSIETVWENEKSKSDKIINSKSLDETINQYFFKLIKSWTSVEFGNPRYFNILAHIFDSNLELIAASNKGYKDIIPLSIKEKESMRLGEYFFNYNVETQKGKYLSLRFLSTPVTIDQNFTYVIRIGASLRTVHYATTNIKIIFFFLLPIIIFINGLFGIFLTNITLSPINKMIDAMNKINAKNLKMKINLPDSKDEVLKLANTFNDMTDRLEYSFATQKRLIEDLSHDLKTPLAIMKGEIEVALKRKRKVKEYIEIFNSVLDEINKLTKMIESLLLISRFESGISQSELKPLNIADILSDLIESAKILAEQRGITVNFEKSGDKYIFGEETQIKNLFLNLLDNAVKYNVDNGNLYVSIGDEDDFVKIVVADGGIGIKEDELPYIFNRYYRIMKSQDKNFSGFGIGLNIVKSIVDYHKGTIEVNSKVGSGTTFTIKLPKYVNSQ
ncbi:MAG: HAMP domain-containing protein [Spirochaetes bacterium]|nr:HAMP domain-containing protein [Spirochaetota bacterium]